MLLLILAGATTWPEPASLNDLALRFPHDFGRKRVFLDSWQHQRALAGRAGKRIRFLRRPTMPSVIVETHHAWDLEEATRFNEPETWDGLADALAAGLIEFFD